MPSARHRWLIALGFAVALKLGDVGVTRLASRHEGGRLDLAQLPLCLPEWQGRELEVPPEQITGLGREAVLEREYTDSQGRTIGANFIYSSKREGLHLPQDCLVSQGWVLMRETAIEMRYGADQGRTARANLVVGVNPHGQQVVELYLFVDADKTAADWGKQYLDMIKHGRAGSKMTCLLLLTSVTAKGAEYESLQRVMRDFMTTIIPSVHRSLGGGG